MHTISPPFYLEQETLFEPEGGGQIAVDFARQAFDLIPLLVHVHILLLLDRLIALPVEVEVLRVVVRAALDAGTVPGSDQWRW